METKVQTDEFITETAQKIRDHYRSASLVGIERVHYKIGVLVLEVKRMSPSKKGANSTVSRIAKSAMMSAEYINKYCEVAETWAPDRFEELVQLRNEEGVGLSFAMFVELAHKDHAEYRDQRLEKALAENLSVRTVRTFRASTRQGRGRAKKLVKALATASQVPEQNLPDEGGEDDIVLSFESEPASPSLISSLEGWMTTLQEKRRDLEAQIDRLREIADKKRSELASAETNSASVSMGQGLYWRTVPPQRYDMSAVAV